MGATFAGPLDVAVLDADERQSLVSIRSFGRAGMRAGAFDATRLAPAAVSRWCSTSGRLPDADTDGAYLAAVVDLATTLRPRVLLPARDATVEALRRGRSEIERESLVALAPESALEIAVDKERTLALAERLGIRVPVTVAINDPADLAAAATRTGFPAVVKPVRSWVRTEQGGRRLGPSVVVDAVEARAAAEAAARHGFRVVLQQWLSGRREAVSLLCVDGTPRARFAQVARRMLPPLGGSSVVRESIQLPPDLTDAADALVRAAGLDGYSEVEFRRDADGRPFLMEVNPRLSASVEVAVRSGVDFPLLLYSWACGRRLPTVADYEVGVRMRWLGGDLKWLRQTVEQRGRPDVPPVGRALRLFAQDFFTPHAYDYVAVRDPVPALAATFKFVLSGARRRYARSRSEARG